MERCKRAELASQDGEAARAFRELWTGRVQNVCSSLAITHQTLLPPLSFFFLQTEFDVVQSLQQHSQALLGYLTKSTDERADKVHASLSQIGEPDESLPATPLPTHWGASKGRRLSRRSTSDASPAAGGAGGGSLDAISMGLVLDESFKVARGARALVFKAALLDKSVLFRSMAVKVMAELVARVGDQHVLEVGWSVRLPRRVLFALLRLTPLPFFFLPFSAAICRILPHLFTLSAKIRAPACEKTPPPFCSRFWKPPTLARTCSARLSLACFL